MTESINRIPDLMGTSAKAIVDNASRLGLTWRLRLGTVSAAPSGNLLTVRMDGDIADISVVSMIGLVPVSSRVYVITIPPAGNYAVGWVGYTHQVMYGETGTELFSFTAQTSVTRAVTFDVPFTTAPVVFTDINSTGGVTQNWFSRAASVTTIGFTIWLHGPSATWSIVPVDWAAFART